MLFRSNSASLEIDVEEIPLNTNNELDDTDIQDVDLELEPVDMDATPEFACDACSGSGCSQCSESLCCDGSGCQICLMDALKHRIASNDSINSPSMNNMKDLMSMLFMMSMATDSESIIHHKESPPADELD